MQILGVIPARYASTRFPGKPLALLGGQSMVSRVYQLALQAKGLSHVVIATEDVRIYDHARTLKAEVYLTSTQHLTGTDRLLEVARRLPGYDAYVNLQGDEPLLPPGHVEVLCNLLQAGKADIVTLVAPLTDATELHSASVVKAVLGNQQQALYFSRAAIPYLRQVAQQAHWPQHHTYYKHIGIYGFRAATLTQLEQLAPGVLEQAEALEQLRWLAAGLTLQAEVVTAPPPAVDTPEDLDKLEALLAAGSLAG